MSEFIYIYIYTVLCNVETTMWILCCTATLIFSAVYLNSAMNAEMKYSYPDGKEEHKLFTEKSVKIIKSKFIVVPLLMLIAITWFVPSKTDIKTIVAAGFIWKGGNAAAEIEGISELPENIVKAMNGFLSEINKNTDDKL